MFDLFGAIKEKLLSLTIVFGRMTSWLLVMMLRVTCMFVRTSVLLLTCAFVLTDMRSVTCVCVLT